jgi:polyhydroxyalkanoate synthesis regulator phasin
MSDLISRAVLCGLGLASLSKDAIQKTAEDFIEQSKLSEEEGRRLVKEIHRKASQIQKTLDKKVEDAVNHALRGLDVAVVKLPHKPSKAAKSAPSRAGAKGVPKTSRK